MFCTGRLLVIYFWIVISTTQCKAKCSSNHVNCHCPYRSTLAVLRGGTSNGPNKTNRSIHSSSSLTSIPMISSNRRACRFYLWNAPSALLYRWCHHLQRDNIYEGRGGKKVCLPSGFCCYVKTFFIATTLNGAVTIILVCSYTTRIYATTFISM
jgi:hypothetical protein